MTTTLLAHKNTYIKHKTPDGQLLKWIGNKQKFAEEICSYFPNQFNTYYEPFLGSGAVMGTLAPKNGIGSDVFSPLVDIWNQLKEDPNELIEWYRARVSKINGENKKEVYEEIKASFNHKWNGADFLFLSRTCYGGVIRFRKADGFMSTPCGVHKPMPVENFAKRVYDWHERLNHCDFRVSGYELAFDEAKEGDLIYCDPPYSHSQSILYGAQSFSLEHLLECISKAKNNGVKVALSIDGNKKSGDFICDLPIPLGLFEQEVFVNCGRSMLKRFQMEGKSLENEVVADRLLLTY